MVVTILEAAAVVCIVSAGFCRLLSNVCNDAAKEVRRWADIAISERWTITRQDALIKQATKWQKGVGTYREIFWWCFFGAILFTLMIFVYGVKS